MRKIRIVRQAAEDLDDVYEPQYSHVLAKIQLLKEFPSLGPALDGNLLGYRCLAVDIFRVIYRILGPDLIEVAYIRHGRRQLP